MKMIILAAGQGTRLMPLTKNKPKCMVEYKAKPIINHILGTTKSCGLDNIAIVNGYKKEILESFLKNEHLKYFTNDKFECTNMVNTLFRAKEFMDDDIIISYGDIIYKKEVLEKLMHSKELFSVVVDTKWKELWAQRMENILDDVETLKINNGKIIELGKKPKSLECIQGQYIGLIKISKKVIKKVINFYENLDKNAMYDGKDFNNMYMTSFIQMIIDNLLDVKPIFIEGKWIEVDCANDLKCEMC